MSAPGLSGPRAFRVLRVVETGLLLTSLVGIATFALSIVSILRIETAPGAGATTDFTREIPWPAWWGIFIFFGSMLLLQAVRVWLHRHRRADGTARADDLGRAADATSRVLADAVDEADQAGETGGRDEPLLYSEDGTPADGDEAG